MSTQTAKVFEFPARHQDGEIWEPWVNEDVAARHFGISSRTLRRWRAEGMPSRLFRGSRRFRLSEIERWHGERSAL